MTKATKNKELIGLIVQVIRVHDSRAEARSEEQLRAHISNSM